jgi:hypothetical protein
VLNIKGGTGKALVPFFKKLGLVATDGAPTELYSRFRNAATAGPAIAEAIKKAYKGLKDVNGYFYALTDKELKDLIVQVTGVSSESRVVRFVLGTLKVLKAFATFENSKSATEEPAAKPQVETAIVQAKNKSATLEPEHLRTGAVGMNLSYTINLNLPATTDQAVFNAIFRSLKEHLLSNAD